MNRSTLVHGAAGVSDILGNRQRAGQSRYTWDAVNRMTSLTNALGMTTYAYRADGMRVAKVHDNVTIIGMNRGLSSLLGIVPQPQPGPEPIPIFDRTLWRYDGQMPVQEVRSGMGGSVVIDSALGARGV